MHWGAAGFAVISASARAGVIAWVVNGDGTAARIQPYAGSELGGLASRGWLTFRALGGSVSGRCLQWRTVFGSLIPDQLEVRQVAEPFVGLGVVPVPVAAPSQLYAQCVRHAENVAGQ